MKQILNTVTAAAVVMLLCSFGYGEDPQPITSGSSHDREVLLDCDTVVVINGYTVHIVRDNGEEVFSGLQIFNNDVKKAMDRALLERIESDLYTLTKAKTDKGEVLTKITKGNIDDFKAITPQTDCSVSSTNSKHLLAEWTVNAKTVAVEIPVSYETAKGTDRTKTENTMIGRIKRSDGKRPAVLVDKDNVEAYGDNMFILPGGSYHSKDVTKNVYLDPSLNPVWDVAYPAESIANLFELPSKDYGNETVELTVLKHEYGQKETILTTVNKFLAEFEKDGCMPFWGIEKLADGKLEGALFLYNQTQGYDHVIKIDCVPNDVINGSGYIKARASLFIPTNNVDNLYMPYVKKSKEQRINYEK